MEYETTQEERGWAMAAYLAKLVAPVLAPLVIYVTKKDQSRFVAFHALQSLYADLACLTISLLALVLAFVLQWVVPVGWLMSRQLMAGAYVAWVGLLIFSILAAVRAYNGEWFRGPLVGACAESQIGTVPDIPPPPPAPEEPAGEPGAEAEPEAIRRGRRG